MVAVGSTSGSFWNPSRGPTSRICTAAGSSLIWRTLAAPVARTLPALSETGQVVILAGGTGGAKLARGMLDVVAPEQLTVIANTGDDHEIYGAYVSPDPDLVSFWLADRIDERGWGIRDDTFSVMDGLRAAGEEVWFNLGDRDLAIGIQRAQALRAGTRLTEAQATIVERFGVRARVLPMSDRPVRTRVLAAGGGGPFRST